jgi:putative transposase
MALRCRLFEGSHSGCYAWLKRPPSCRQREEARLKVEWRAAHQRSRETYGVRRLPPELAAAGFVAGRARLARRRRDLGLTYS